METSASRSRSEPERTLVNQRGAPRHAAQPARLRQAAAPVFWRRIREASVRRARVHLQEVSEEELADCIASPMAGVLASIIRAAGARVPEVSRSSTISKAHAHIEAELLEVVQLGLRRGLSPDQPTPWAEAEIFTPPLVAAASYDFERLLDLLLAEGADTMQRNSDGEVALHAAVDRPSALRRLVAVPQPLLQTSLAAISGKNHGVDADAWRAWWESEGGDVEFPPRAPFYPGPTVAPGDAGNAYYEIPVYADRIVFVIDTSLSMEGERMETAKRELVSAIHTLDPLVAFTVISFSDAARAWQPQLIAAGDDAKRSAAAYVSALTAAGKTASFDALDAAFRYDAEAIFFLSDGEPTAGRMVNPAQIIRFVAEANKNRRLSLHTIGIMPDNGLAQFLQVLATANNGAYRHVAD